MLWTLWRAILIDFWRLLLLATAVLVAVVAFAATVKPLADGKLTADQAIRFMVYAVPPMLAYALPFAAGFAATLTYHRYTADNEVTAAHAGGVSHAKLLFPALLSGLLLAGLLWGLNDRVIPGFLARMERMITRDFARIMVASLQQGESAVIGDTEIHADHVEQVPPEPGSPTQQKFLLAGVAMVETDHEGNILIDATAARAWIFMYPVWALGPEDRARIGDDESTAVIIKFVDVTIHRDGAPQSAEVLVAPAIPVPSMFMDDPKYYSSAQMSRIRADPDRMGFIDSRRATLARVMGAVQAFTRFNTQLQSGNPVVFRAADGSVIRVRGSGMASHADRWTILPTTADGIVEVEVQGPNGRAVRMHARAASLGAQPPAEDDPLAHRSDAGGLRLSLMLTGVRVLDDAGTGARTELNATEYADLMPARDPLPGLLELDSESLVIASQPLTVEGAPGYHPAIEHAASELRNALGSLRREILSKRQERWAMSAQCVVMVLIGAVMAMRLKGATPLFVYLWSFVPAILSVIMLEAGQQAVHASGLAGLPVLWSAILALGLVTLLAYRRLVRH